MIQTDAERENDGDAMLQVLYYVLMFNVFPFIEGSLFQLILNETKHIPNLLCII